MTFIEHGVEVGCDPSVSADGTIRILAGGIVNQNVGASVSAQNWTAASGDPSFDRYDTLYATSSGSISALTGVVDGTLVQPDSTDVVIAKYIMRAGATTVAAADLQDVRTFVKKNFGSYHVSGLWYGPSVSNAGKISSWTNNSMYLLPQFVVKEFSIQAMGIYVAISGSLGTVGRLGIYQDDGTGGLSLLAEAGTASLTSSSASVSVPLSTTLTPGWWWFALAFQSLGAVKPILQAVALPYGSPVGASSLAQLAGQGVAGAIYFTGISGSLPAIPTSPDYSQQSLPGVWVQAA